MADVATVPDSSAPTASADELDTVPPIPSQQSAEHLPAAAEPAQSTELPEEFKNRLDSVIYSDIGITTLLSRLKQSVASAKDLAVFFKKRGALEEEHAQGLRKLSRTIHEAAHRSDNRQGTFSQSYDEMYRTHERLAEHGLQFAASLLQMSEDLQEHAASIERGRKQWKQTGLTAEKRAQDAEAVAEKAKSKYDSLAEQYDRVRTGDKQAGVFGLKGPKSAAQHEEDLLRKVQNADSDYAAKVQAAQAARQELISTHRPQAVQNLQQLIAECDAASVLQLQKYATFYEKLLLGQGLCISPLKSDALNNATPADSLREIIARINNSKDFQDDVLDHEGNAVTSEQIQYTRHPALAASSATAAAPVSQPSTFNNKRSSMSLSPHPQPPASVQPASQASPSTATRTPYVPYPGHNDRPSSAQGPQQPPYSGSPAPIEPYSAQQPGATRNPLLQTPGQPAPLPSGPGPNFQHLPPLRPVFGVSLEDLYRRDGTAVPLVVYQCLQAVELFGLDTEGIYRLSGSANHINQMKAIFDNDSSKVDFTNPENFYHDVNSVAGLLKQFFRDLPEPLLTSQFYPDFIASARIDDDIQRRDSLHALINSLPDAHYATLRALILHLNKVQEHYPQNRMNAGNIAICFGPTLMGANSGGNIADAGWQVRVIETILVNTFQIFDDD